ncbi:MAG: hypothetical protein K2J08_09055, partial [Ruminococcus sp.]|nr:hypothetical protein [Ruminococcus sp.]
CNVVKKITNKTKRRAFGWEQLWQSISVKKKEHKKRMCIPSRSLKILDWNRMPMQENGIAR